PVDVFIGMLTSAMSDMIGVSLNEFTVTLKLVDAEPPFWSVTVTVMTAVPVSGLIALSTRTRLEPLPPKNRFVFGIREGFEDEPVSVKNAAGVSTSRTTIGIGALGMSSFNTWFGMAEIDGRSLTGL